MVSFASNDFDECSVMTSHPVYRLGPVLLNINQAQPGRFFSQRSKLFLLNPVACGGAHCSVTRSLFWQRRREEDVIWVRQTLCQMWNESFCERVWRGSGRWVALTSSTLVVNNSMS